MILQVLFNEKSETLEATPPKRKIINAEISTQTDSPKSSQERYFIIEELTTEENEAQQISIVTEDDLSQEARDAEQFDLTINHDESPIKNEDMSITDVEMSSLNSSKKRNRFDRFDCYLCNQQFTGNHIFLKHFSSVHPKQELKYKCYECSGFVKKYRSYTRHLESHLERRFE